MRYNHKKIAPPSSVLSQRGLVLLLLRLLLLIGLHTTRSSSFEQPHRNKHNHYGPSTSTTTTTTTAIPTPRDYLVQGLADIEPAFRVFEESGGSMYAGLVPTTLYSDLAGNSNNDDDDDDDHDHEKEQEQQVGELMFWLFAPAQPKFDDTLLIWNNGGPGCSSLSGALFENSPVTIPRYPAGYFGIDPTERLEPNPYGWTNATMIMYVEHPHGTGFTHGAFPSNETEVGRDFYNFLQNVYTIFDNDNDNSESDTTPDLRSKKLSFFGESYAGMFVPSIAYYIHQQNKRGEHPHINLWGIALGNGWIDAKVQGPAVVEYAWWHGMIDSTTVAAMKQEWDNCQDGSAPQPKPFHPFTTPDECGIMGAVMQAAGVGVVDWGGPNAYDVTTWDPYLMLDAKDGAISQFYNNPAVQDALHVEPHTDWSACMAGAGRRRRRLNDDNDDDHDDNETDLLPGQILLAHDQPLSMAQYIATLLDEADIRVLIYNGDRDLTTNAQGSERVLNAMEWSGANGWLDTDRFKRGLWFPFEKKFGGYIKSFHNLEFLVIANSGHLVPFNEDELALDLVTRFMGGEPYLDKELPKFKVSPKNSMSTTAEFGMWEEQAKGPKRAVAVGLGGITLIALTAFASGFFISRRAKGREGYEMVASH